MIELHHPVVPTRSTPTLSRRSTTYAYEEASRRRRWEITYVIAFGHARGGGDDGYAPSGTEGLRHAGRRKRQEQWPGAREKGEELTLRCEVLRDHVDARVALLAAPKFRTSYPPPRRGDDPSTRTTAGATGRGGGPAAYPGERCECDVTTTPARQTRTAPEEGIATGLLALSESHVRVL